MAGRYGLAARAAGTRAGAIATGLAGLPRAEPVSIDFPNNHLSYAITWYGLAVALVVDLHPVQLHHVRQREP